MIRPEQETTKHRIVFDSSAKTKNGISLNNFLETGSELSLPLIWRDMNSNTPPGMATLLPEQNHIRFWQQGKNTSRGGIKRNSLKVHGYFYVEDLYSGDKSDDKVVVSRLESTYDSWRVLTCQMYK